MPKMNGFELYQQLKKKDCHVTVCSLTAVSEFRDFEQYKIDVSPKPRERYFVAKPISEDDLVRRVSEMLTNEYNNHVKPNSATKHLPSTFMPRACEKYKYVKRNMGIDTLEFLLDDIRRPFNHDHPERGGFNIVAWPDRYIKIPSYLYSLTRVLRLESASYTLKDSASILLLC